jgi:5'(3')-deoxyribonucleotidase
MQERNAMKVYVDMDRVIADFDKGVREYAHMETSGNQGNEKQDAQMWERLSKIPHFYDKLDLLEGAENGIRTLYEQFGSDLEILTGVPKPSRGLPTASEDKKIWMKRKFGLEIVVNTVRRAEKKQFCTGRDCYLIDDYEENIREWEAAGGTGILFENWNQVLNIISDILSHDNLEEYNERSKNYMAAYEAVHAVNEFIDRMLADNPIGKYNRIEDIYDDVLMLADNEAEKAYKVEGKAWPNSLEGERIVREPYMTKYYLRFVDADREELFRTLKKKGVDEEKILDSLTKALEKTRPLEKELKDAGVYEKCVLNLTLYELVR